MKNILLNSTKFSFMSLIAVVLLASCGLPAYAKHVHQKADELALVGYQFSLGVQLKRAFVRNISMHSHFMAEQERDTFTCVGNLVSLSTNPFQLCHPHLVVNGKASMYSLGAHVVMPQINTLVFILNTNKKAVVL